MLAGKGLDSHAIKGMLGWAQIDTSQDYVAHNVENLDRKLFINL